MKFAKLIRAVGLNPTNFPNASELFIDVYNYKNTRISDESFDFPPSLFSYSRRSYEKFQELCGKLEKEAGTGKDLRLIIKITDIVLTLHTPKNQLLGSPVLLFR